MYVVDVKTDCSHVKANAFTSEYLESVFPSFEFQCDICKDDTENWVCCECLSVGCSYYVEKHMRAHGDETGHNIVFSTSDLSTWCYKCEAYISDPKLQNIKGFFYKKKFGASPPPGSVSVQPAASAVDNKKILSDNSLNGIAEYIKSGECKNVIILTGAGMSVAAGIPDFRTPSIGLYANLAKYNLPYPEAIFSIEYFKENPKPFYLLAKTFLKSFDVKPTKGHYLISLFEKNGLLLRNYTQNIDLLEEKAGVTDEKLVYPHGNVKSAQCIDCSKKMSMADIQKAMDNDEVPTCECGGTLKPSIVFFGEKLTEKFEQLVSSDFSNCDLLIIMGTSLKVQPVSLLPEFVPSHCPRLVVNLTPMQIPGFDFVSSNSRDVFYEGAIEQFASEFSHILGWSDQLEEAHSQSL